MPLTGVRVLDLTTVQNPRGVEILRALARRADVVVENYRPDVKRRLGIDYEVLGRDNPRLVYGSISGFGQTGPYRDRPGYDQIVQGMSGLMSLTGTFRATALPAQSQGGRFGRAGTRTRRVWVQPPSESV